MKAVLLHKYGTAEELIVGDLPSPAPAAGEILIRVVAAGVNPADWQFRRGDFASLLPLAFPAILGWDVAGVVAAVGTDVENFRAGDAVFAFCDMSRSGSYAEYVVIRKEHVAAAPRRLPIRHAAAVPLAALTAWQALHDIGELSAGQSVLITAAAGGVGQFAVQLARAAGAEVIAVARPQNHAMLRELGATECVDYLDPNWSKKYVGRCALVIDGAGGETRERAWQVLQQNGLMIAVAMPPIDQSDAQRRGVRAAFAQVMPNGERLAHIAALIDAGELVVNIDSEYALEEVRAAHARSESRQACGKILLNVSDQRPLRRYVVTGSASGIGRATVALLRAQGAEVIGIDRHGAEIIADLSTGQGRQAAVDAVHRRGADGIDALILCAGLAGGFHPGESVIAVNYFGAVDIAVGLRPLLARGREARVVIVSSSASILKADQALVDLCLAGDETGACAAARCHSPEEMAVRSGPIYAASKRALTRWIRRQAPLPEWAGSGILLNGVAPGLVKTPMTAPLLASEVGRQVLAKAVPRALPHAAQPQDLAQLIGFLASAENRYMVGQVPFCDGGKEVLMRSDDLLQDP